MQPSASSWITDRAHSPAAPGAQPFCLLIRLAGPASQTVAAMRRRRCPRHSAARRQGSEQHDPFGREGDENVLHRLDGIALTSVTASVQSRVVEALDRLALDQLRPSDRLIGVGEPKRKSAR
jgi:hypothetical protein